MQFFAPCPTGVASALAAELEKVDAQSCREMAAGVHFEGDLDTAYKAILWSRCASRVLVNLAEFDAEDEDQLYKGVYAMDWPNIFPVHASMAITFNARSSRISHSQFATLKVKDAIVDKFRDVLDQRPNIDTDDADIRVAVYVEKGKGTVYLDLSGAMYQHGYRARSLTAPLRENLAAALCYRAQWPDIAANGGDMVDLCCGSGTIVIEAAMIIANVAPGLIRKRHLFNDWTGHDAALWETLSEEARAAKITDFDGPRCFGADIDEEAVEVARENAELAGVSDLCQFEHGDLADFDVSELVEGAPPGLVLSNPPYGTRLGEVEELTALYATYGQRLINDFKGWHAGIFTSSEDLGHALGLRAKRINKLRNGAIDCQLLRFEIHEKHIKKEGGPLTSATFLARHADTEISDLAFANRFKKNLKHRKRWAKREQIFCYRVYDADIPEYSFAIDLYSNKDEQYLIVQEYAAPKEIDKDVARQRVREVMTQLPEVSGIAAENIYFKVRQRQRGKQQYEKLDDTQNAVEVFEGQAKLEVNFSDYLDTGLFLDHRPVRLNIAKIARDKHFLNLFCYTGVATVHAALGGAKSSLSVDMSRTYIDWAKRNLERNDILNPLHRYLQTDCMAWLDEQAREQDEVFDLIFLDPPTFSTSKRMEKSFDVLRDQVEIISNAMAILASDGLLLFSNNNRRFKLDEDIEAKFDVVNISKNSIDEDFGRNSRIHQLWEIRHKA